MSKDKDTSKDGKDIVINIATGGATVPIQTGTITGGITIRF